MSGLSDAGQIVGQAQRRTRRRFVPFWRRTVMTDLGTHDGNPISIAISTNVEGPIAGAFWWGFRNPRGASSRFSASDGRANRNGKNCLLVTQSYHGINAHCATRRDVTRQQDYAEE